MSAATSVTNFADAGTTVPMCAAVALTLLALRRPDLALRWSVINVAVWATTVGVKLAGYALASPAGPHVLISPSGHVAGAAAAFAGVAALCGLPRAGSAIIALLVAAAVAATRVVLHDHTIAEVLLGAAIGLAGAACCIGFLTPPALRRPALLAVAALVVLLTHGAHLSPEPLIAQTSGELRAALR